ncbi:unnamed protein product, partial [Prorocentrum cordatum]
MAKPKADKDGWVDQPRGRRAQRQARSAASRAASTKSQTSASAASGAPSGGGITAIERLQATVEQLEALQAGPPDGVDSCFTDVAANQLEAKRAELARAQREAAEQKASTMRRSTLLHKEANAISKAEKRLRSARQVLEQKQAARDLAEVQLQKAQEELAALDGEVEEASRALQVLEEAAREEAEARQRQRAAEWAGASQVPGLLTQLDKLPEASGSSNFEVAWAAIRAQMEAVRAQLAGPPSAPKRAPWAESCPMDETSSDDGDLAGSSGPWQPQPAADRGQAERHGSAHGEWPQDRSQGGRARSEASAAGPRLHVCSSAEVARSGSKRPHDLGSEPAPPAPGQATAAAQGVRCGLEVLGVYGDARRWSMEVIEASVSRHGARPHPVRLQEACVAPRRPEEARGATRRMEHAVFLHPFAPSDIEGPLVESGSFAALVCCALRAAEVARQAPSDLKHRMIEVTVSTASGLGRLACSQMRGLDLLAAYEVQPQPLGAQAAMMVFIPMSDGGVRPIAFVPLLMRSWSSLRQPIGALWEVERDHCCLGGKADCEYEKAGGLHNAYAAFARESGCASASLCLGITKLYVNLRHDFLCLLVLYQRPRILCFVGLATESFTPKPGSAGLEVARLLRDQLLPLSAAKTTFLASSPSGVRQLGEYWKTQGWTFCKTAQVRNLSTGATIARQGVHEGRVRAPGALHRARRLGCLRAAAGVELDLIHKAGPAACMGWGRTVMGIADRVLHSWRPAAGRSARTLHLGAALGLCMSGAERRRRRDLDPAVFSASNAVQMLAGQRQSGELPLRMVARGLEEAATRGASAATWKRRASPIDAVAWTLAQIDWHSKSERCLVADRGDELDPMLLELREDTDAGLGARQASDRHEMQKLSRDPPMQRPPCSKRGECMVRGACSGVKPRLKARSPGSRTDKSGRNLRSLREKGPHLGGWPRAGKQRVKGEGIPALRARGQVPGHAQERCLEWLGIEVVPA